MPDPRFSTELLTLKKRLAAVFAIAAILILGAGFAYHHRYQVLAQKEAGDLLSSIRHFKTEQLLFWRADRLSDTDSLLDTPVLSKVLNDLASNPGNKALNAQVRDRLTRYLRHNRYRSALLAWPDGRVQVSAGEAPKTLGPETRALVAKAAASLRSELGDFYLDHSGMPRIDVAAKAASGPGGGLFLVLEIAPEDYLYPMMKQWPTNSATGETMLGRQEGDYAVALNDLRLTASAPFHRTPLTPDSPVSKALKGETGVVFGTDYRGRKVMASVGAIRDAGWVLAVKMDWDEIMAGHGRASALILLFTFFMLLAAGLVTYMLFLLQEAGYKRSLKEVESERERYRFSYETLSDKANDMILLSDPEKRALLMVNHKACEVYGYTQEEMLNLRPESLIPPENIPLFNTRFKALKEGAGMVYETVHIKKNGERFPIEVSATGVRQDGRDLVYFICRDITERKRLEEEVKDRERRLAGVMYSLPGMAYRCKNDPHWTIEFVSQGCEKLTGYKPAELLGNNAVSFNSMILPEDRDRVWREVQNAIAANKPYQVIYRIRRKDGNERTVWEQGDAIRGENGAVEALEGLIIDNSEKAAAEEELRDTQDRLRITLEESQIGTWDWDVAKDVWTASATYYTMLGYPPEQGPADRKAWLERVHPDDRQAVAERIRGVLEGSREKYQYEARIRHANGSYRWHIVLGAVVSKDDAGKPRRLMGVRMDITERKLSEQKLADAAKDWTKTFDAIDDVIWVLGPDQKILRANAATGKVLGKSAESVIGRHCWEIVHGTSGPIEGCPVTRVFSSLRRETMDYRIGDKFYEVIADPILGADGAYAGAVHVLRDITEPRRAKMRTEELNRELTKNLRLYTILAQVNQAGAQIKDRAKLFTRICEILVKTAGFRMAWIGYPDKDTGRVLPLCSAGETGRYLDSVKISVTDGPSSKGPTGEAAATGKVSACQDIASDPRMAPWRDKAQAAGFASSAAVPLYDGAKLVALLSLYSAEKNAFDEAELRMLASVQAETSLAVAAISSEQQRAEAQAGLERTAKHLSHALEAAPVVLFTLVVMGEKFIPQWVSGNPRGITGHDPDEILGITWFKDSLHPEDRARVIGEAAEVLKKGGLTHEFRLRRKDGGYAWVRETLKLSKDNSGEITGSWTDITPQKEAELRCKNLLEGRRPG